MLKWEWFNKSMETVHGYLPKWHTFLIANYYIISKVGLRLHVIFVQP